MGVLGESFETTIISGGDLVGLGGWLGCLLSAGRHFDFENGF